MKKWFGILFTVLFACMASVAMAETKGKSGNFSYSIKGNGTAVITGYDWENSTGDVYVPSMIDGYTVTSIGDEAFMIYNEKVKSGWQYTPAYNIHLPDTITSIGNKAFFGAHISGINIPNSVVQIGEGAFANCFLLKGFSVPSSHSIYTTIDGVLYDKTKKELVCWPLGLMIDEKELTIPNGIVRIGAYAFYSGFMIAEEASVLNWHGIEYASQPCNMSIPDSVKYFGDYSLYGMNIYSMKIKSESIDYIGKYAFSHTGIQHGAEFAFIDEIGEYAFSYANYYDFSSIKFESVLTISEGAFSNSFVNFRGKVKAIGKDAFFDCTLSYAPDLSECTSIAENAFSHAYVVDIQTKDKPWVINGDISKGAFSNMKFSPKYGIAFGEGCTYIGDDAFSYVEFYGKTENIEIPDTVKYVGTDAFEGCQCKEFILSDGIEFIGDNAFEKSGVTLYVNNGSYAEFWGNENGYNVKVNGEEDLSWLN